MLVRPSITSGYAEAMGSAPQHDLLETIRASVIGDEQVQHQGTLRLSSVPAPGRE